MRNAEETIRRIRDAAQGSAVSSIALVVSNLVPVWGVLFWDWNVFNVLFLFWMENVFIGVFNVLKMSIAKPTDVFSWIARFFMIPFL